MHACRAPRLKAAPPSWDAAVRLHFHSRGAIGHLFIEPQPALPPLGEAGVPLRVRAVGLNFRDVLNVLGEYPGDPGPPGGDAAGIVDMAPSAPRSAYGLAHAPLAWGGSSSAARPPPRHVQPPAKSIRPRRPAERG